MPVECDIRQPESIAAAFDAVEAAVGPIDVLINNAAGNFPVPAEDMSPNAWRTVVDIVLNGTFLCCRDLARRLIPLERDGAIVNVGASYAWTGGPGFAHSAAAKAGVKNLTETLAVEWAPYGIRVNGLVPGLMPHEDETAAIAGVPGKDDGPDSRVPAGRVGFPRELAWAATYLCSPYASYISGHSMVVDGANWQRRHTVQPPFTPIRDQLGRRSGRSGLRIDRLAQPQPVRRHGPPVVGTDALVGVGVASTSSSVATLEVHSLPSPVGSRSAHSGPGARPGATPAGAGCGLGRGGVDGSRNRGVGRWG